ncbi:TPR repeat containing protein [Leptospirillum ferriphilum]|jgi:predicted Zn-dependent protease|uniref:TPR repeat containing protein n=3 Tax=Nitrospiraceae TaxID=189779 RepID=A0A094W9H2_9BACT|nr:tetratricopeptide repeat protein [Leptospirillum ferriphilum]EAY57299.1 MAG: putative TPR domain containing protein [Leptospirillum rubarum]EDZ38515.1 MAG: putative TPR domain-containing protein [Leptospirillum sp. Group II '5-way CG']EIJ77388.1 MAG: Putative TPR domain containing protein [Leptospirillum sp. Group II 'C75']KGA93140.1 TPR repeat containing protein [Leptospirillum ferriphilum]
MLKMKTGEKMEQDRLDRLEKLWKLDPSDPVVGLGLGAGLLEAGQPARAREVLEAVLRQKPGYAAAWEILGNALESLGDRDEAIRIYQKGIEVSRSGGFLAPEKQMSRRLKRLLRDDPGSRKGDFL